MKGRQQTPLDKENNKGKHLKNLSSDETFITRKFDADEDDDVNNANNSASKNY